MYKVAVGILKNDFDAADAIQQSILTCYEKLKELKKAQYFKTWPAYFLLSIPRTPDHLPFAPALQEISFIRHLLSIVFKLHLNRLILIR